MGTPATDRTQPPSRNGEGMVWIPGGTFLMGSDDFYPEEAPVHHVDGRRLLDGRAPGDGRRVPPLREGDRLRDRRRAAARPGRLPRTPTPTLLVPGSLVFRKTAGPVDLRRLPQLVGVRPGRGLERPGRAGSTIDGREQHPVVHVAYEDVEAYATLGGQGAADRGRVGVRRPRRPGGRRLHLGRRALPGRARRWPTPGRASSRGRT